MTDRPAPKHPRYQDYVIKNGQLVGEFEDMYRDHEDPWKQMASSDLTPDRAVALSTIRRLVRAGAVTRVLEIGCGLGLFTQQISETGAQAFGTDISSTAIEKAAAGFKGPTFLVNDFSNTEVYADIKPDLIVMSEISWYVLEQLQDFSEFCRASLPDSYLLHILTFYPPGEQTYGKDYFSDFNGLKAFLPIDAIEEAEFRGNMYGNTTRSYFLGRWRPAP